MTATTLAPAWAPDAVLPGFEAATIALPDDYDGAAVATLVRRQAPGARRAVLYIHGFVDYFFQAHVAERFNAEGFQFYALDLRKHGRSLRPHQRPNFCRDLREYFPEIDAAIEIVAAECAGPLLLYGHSTGGLTAALYAAEGARRAEIDALFLNSPFFALQKPPLILHTVVPVIAAIGRVAPHLPVDTISPLYAQSIHRSHRGEWEFNLEWKPIEGFPACAGWGRAIYLGQRQVAAGLGLTCPILVMHSARSVVARRWTEELMRADAVLPVEGIRRVAARLGGDVSLVSIEGGMHDLMLSAAPVRERVFAQLFAWTARVGL